MQKKTYGYKERNEEKRAEFLKIIATKEPQNLVYIDESGIDNTELWILPEGTEVLCSKIW